MLSPSSVSPVSSVVNNSGKASGGAEPFTSGASGGGHLGDAYRSPFPRKGRGAGGLGLVVLAPDRAGAGTNALLLRPPGSMPFAFGAGSYAGHLALAREHGVAVATYRAAGTAFDVDGPADLAELRAGGLWPLVEGRAV